MSSPFARLEEALATRSPVLTARLAWTTDATLVVADRAEEVEVTERLRGLQVVHADDLARRGILAVGGNDVLVTPRAALRLAELGAALTREA